MALKWIAGKGIVWVPDKPKPAGPDPSTVFGSPAPAVASTAPQQYTPAAPAAPAPVSPDAGWQDSAYTGALAATQSNLGNLKTYLTNQGRTLGLNYGVNYQGDPISGASGFSIDPNVDVTNPFSRAALLKRSYSQATKGNTNSYASHGQLYSGALQNAQNHAGFANQQQQDALLKDFSSQFGGLYQQWLSAQAQAQQAALDAQAAALARAQAVPPAAPDGPAPVYQTPAGTPMPTTPNSPAGPAITDPVTGRVYQPAQGVAVAPGWMIVNGKLVRV